MLAPNNREEPCQRDAQGQGTGQARGTRHDSIYRKCPARAKPQTGGRPVMPGQGRREWEPLTGRGSVGGHVPFSPCRCRQLCTLTDAPRTPPVHVRGRNTGCASGVSTDPKRMDELRKERREGGGGGGRGKGRKVPSPAQLPRKGVHLGRGSTTRAALQHPAPVAVPRSTAHRSQSTSFA